MKKILLPLLLICFVVNVNAQNNTYDYYKIGITSDKTSTIAMMMGNTYNKSFYTNEAKTLYLNQDEKFIELIEFNPEGEAVQYYLFKDDKKYILKDFTYKNKNLEEWAALSEDQKKLFKDLNKIDRETKKVVDGFDCFLVTMTDPSGKEAKIEMFVTEQLPNLPNHFPLAPNILMAEPLEIKMEMMGAEITAGIIESKKDIDLFQHLGVSLENPTEVNQETYNKLKSE